MNGTRPEVEAMVLVACTPFLKSTERAALLSAAPNHRDLLRLTTRDVEVIIGRALYRARWRPELALPSIERSTAWFGRPENGVLWIGDRDYPVMLRETYDPPPVLFVRGDPEREWRGRSGCAFPRLRSNVAITSAKN